MRVILETKRLLLRECEESDFEALKKIVPGGEDEYTKKWLDWCLSSYQKDGFGLWAVIYKENGDFIGNCGISMQPIDGEWRKEIGYHIRKDYHRQGIATEVAKAIRDYFFSNYPDDEIYSYMDVDNIPSSKVAINNGMKYIKNFITKNGKECKVYKITRKEWEEQNKGDLQ